MTGTWRHRMIVAAPLAVVAFLAAMGRVGDGVTVCPFALCTGMACPGCGMTRAAAHLVRGDLATAIEYHPLVPLVALLAAGGWVWYLLRRRGRVRPMPTRWINLAVIGTGVALLGVWVIRALSGNLPPV